MAKQGRKGQLDPIFEAIIPLITACVGVPYVV